MAMRLLGAHDLSNISVLRANSGGYLSEPAIDLGDSWTRDGLYLGGAITLRSTKPPSTVLGTEGSRLHALRLHE